MGEARLGKSNTIALYSTAKELDWENPSEEPRERVDGKVWNI